jgi:hypothetical protein
MADIHELPTAESDVHLTLEGAKAAAKSHKAHGCIVILVHGDDQVHMCTSGIPSYAGKAGYLQTAIQGAWQEVIGDE